MTKNSADHSARTKLNTIRGIQTLFKRLSRKFENLAVASDYSSDDLLNDRITALELRVAVLEEKIIRSEQNESIYKKYLGS